MRIHDITLSLGDSNSVDLVVIEPTKEDNDEYTGIDGAGIHILIRSDNFPRDAYGDSIQECAKNLGDTFRTLIRELDSMAQCFSSKSQWKKATHKTRGGVYELLARSDDKFHVREAGKPYEGYIVTGAYMRAEFVLL